MKQYKQIKQTPWAFQNQATVLCLCPDPTALSYFPVLNLPIDCDHVILSSFCSTFLVILT